MPELDLIDLRILDQLQKTGNISRTAELVRLSQPSVSVRLNNLRHHFKDPLFVRTSHGMRPTPRAANAITAARQALRTLEQAVTLEDDFNAATSQRTFQICMTDVSQIAILPRLVTRLKSKAPGVCIDIVYPQGEIERMLEVGEADLAIGVRLKRHKGIVSQPIFQERFVCLASRNHPRIGNVITRQQFLKESHVATKILSGSMGSWIIDQTLNFDKSPRRISLRVPTLLGLSQIVANTDLLAVVPLHLAKAFADEGHVKVLNLPFSLPSYRVAEYWHQRYHTDAGHRWMRTAIFEMFSEFTDIEQAAGKAKSGVRKRKTAR